MRIAPLAAGLVFAATAPSASADVTHVVQKGHTLEAIAHRYHVSVQAIAETNHLKDTRHLKPGQELVIPGVDPPRRKDDGSDKAPARAHAGESRTTRATLEQPLEPRGRGERVTPAARGVIVAIRQGEEYRIRIRDSRGHIADSALTQFSRLSRQGNVAHPADSRLVTLIGIVSDHFGGKPIEVVSGYRAYSPTQYTPHSNHNYGKALDFRIRGVSNETLRDFCRTLRNTGCGYYPNSTFVHLDVRDGKAYWVDFSRPGEPPRYEKSDSAADEGTSDVPDDKSAPVENPPAPSPTHELPNPLIAPPADDSVRNL